jgi:hypothetical protein
MKALPLIILALALAGCRGGSESDSPEPTEAPTVEQSQLRDLELPSGRVASDYDDNVLTGDFTGEILEEREFRTLIDLLNYAWKGCTNDGTTAHISPEANEQCLGDSLLVQLCTDYLTHGECAEDMKYFVREALSGLYAAPGS